MNCIYKRKLFLITCLFFVFSTFALAQNNSKAGVGEVSEIIIPTSASIQNNFNLLYEIHLSREGIPTPSFWYKIIFSKDCSFEFTLIPISEDDNYDFYFYKVESNLDFCNAVREEKIVSCNASRVHKVYTNREQSDKFRAGLVDVKPIQVKAGDAIYIEVFSTKGNDCGHILDFRTTGNSFVVKVVNDNCSGNKNTDSTIVGKYKPSVTDEKQAMEIFRNLLCPQDKKALFVSSIQVNDQNVKVQKKLDFTNYSKSEAPKYLKPKPVEPQNVLPKVITLNNAKADSLMANASAIKKSTSDSTKKTDSIVPPKNVVVADTVKPQPFIKSTADLNSIEEHVTPINYNMVAISTDKERNSTRLEVDNTLFLLLREDLKRKTESTNDQLQDYSKALKKASDSDKKEEIKVAITEIKAQKLDLQSKLKNTELKLKRISKLLREERSKKIKPEESVFAKSIRTADINTKDSSFVKQQLPLGLIYKVQIGVYKNPVSVDVFKGLTPVFEEVFTGGVKYSAGAFTHFIDAQHAKDYIRTMGLTDSFIVAYYNGKRLPIEEAKRYENQ